MGILTAREKKFKSTAIWKAGDFDREFDRSNELVESAFREVGQPILEVDEWRLVNAAMADLAASRLANNMIGYRAACDRYVAVCRSVFAKKHQKKSA